MNKREKSEIELLIEKRINKLNDLLMDLLKDSSYSYEERTQIKSEIEFLERLLQSFRTLEDTRAFGKEQTYNELLMSFVLNNLPPKMSEKIREAIREDKKKIEIDNIQKLREMKEAKLQAIRHFRANNTYESYRYINESIVSKMKHKSEVSQKNKRTMESNEKRYSDIINWIEKQFVSRYTTRVPYETYYISPNGRGESIDNLPMYSKERKEAYDKLESEKTQERTNHNYDIKICQELLSYAKLEPSLAKKIQKCMDLLKQNEKEFQLIEIIRELSINKKYNLTIKIIASIAKELQERRFKNKKIIQQLQDDIKLHELYEEKRKEINKRKEEKLNSEKKKVEENSSTMINQTINPVVEKENKKWIDAYINEFMRRALGKDPKTAKQDDAYFKALSFAKMSLNDYLSTLNERYMFFIQNELYTNLFNYITEKYGITDQGKIMEFISYNGKTKEEKFIIDMVKEKKMAPGTKVEDLTSKDLKEIEKRSDKLSHVDSKVIKAIEEIENLKHIDFALTYGIKYVEEDLERRTAEYEKSQSR